MEVERTGLFWETNSERFKLAQVFGSLEYVIPMAFI